MDTRCYFCTVYLTPGARCILGRCQEIHGLSVELVVTGHDSILAIVTASVQLGVTAGWKKNSMRVSIYLPLDLCCRDLRFF